MIRTEHREEKFIFPFVSYTPEKSGEKLPLIIQLHGAGERGDGKEDLKKVDVHGFSHFLEKEDADCIFVMPQCPKESFWAAKVESLGKFVRQIIKEFNANTDKVYLTGLSMGGYGTWYTAMAEPGLFAAIAPVCGGGMAWNAGMIDVPVWAFHGVDDPTVSVTQSDEMFNALRACGKDVTYTRLDGVGHDVWKHTYDKELLCWLLDKKRK